MSVSSRRNAHFRDRRVEAYVLLPHNLITSSFWNSYALLFLRRLAQQKQRFRSGLSQFSWTLTRGCPQNRKYCVSFVKDGRKSHACSPVPFFTTLYAARKIVSRGGGRPCSGHLRGHLEQLRRFLPSGRFRSAKMTKHRVFKANFHLGIERRRVLSIFWVRLGRQTAGVQCPLQCAAT